MGVHNIDTGFAPKGVFGAGFVRPDDKNSRNRDEKSSRLFREWEDNEGEVIEGEAHLVSVTVARPPPDDPGVVVAHQLAGDSKTDEALGRLLEDLEDEKTTSSENEAPQKPVPPVAPFTYASGAGGHFHRAASAYEWGSQMLNSKDPLVPGAIYSEQF